MLRRLSLPGVTLTIMLLVDLVQGDGSGTQPFQDPDCCLHKRVGEFTYTFLRMDHTIKQLGCLTECVYQRDNFPDSKYCFASGNLMSECQDYANSSSILITGGYSGGHQNSHRQNSTELFPPISSCIPPSMPEARSGHVTFTTDSGIVATCGGRSGNDYLNSCIVWNIAGKEWERIPSKVQDLPENRLSATSVNVPGTGVFILGGDAPSQRNSSLLLRSGMNSWTNGPQLPGTAYRGCSVFIGGGSFLLIGGRSSDKQVREYSDVNGWEPLETWPQLKIGRYGHGCGIVGDKVVVAGGYGKSTTEIIDISKRIIYPGGSLNWPRYAFAMVSLGPFGKQTLYSMGGEDQGTYLGSVERWIETTTPGTWVMDKRIIDQKSWMGFTVIKHMLVC